MLKIMNEEKNQYYALHLWEPALPGFCSGSKAYYGTEDTLTALAEKMIVEDQYADTGKAILDYFNGNKAAKHNVAYSEIPILEPVQYKRSATIRLPKTVQEHINVWGFPYNFRFDEALIRQIVIKYEDNYIRCLQVWLTNLEMEMTDNEWDEMTEGFWGNAILLEVDKRQNGSFIFSNLLYIEEERFDKMHDAFESIGKPELLKMKGIYDEVVADG